jgi:sulfofructose kinase
MGQQNQQVDVLCVGHACYDLVFSVDEHPNSDEKIVATGLMQCGGGPAANAAIAVSRLGLTAGFAGYLGNDLYGELHVKEMQQHQVNLDSLVRASSPTPLSTVLLKPDGQRALVNYKGSTRPLTETALDLSTINAKTILFDGHEPRISLALLKLAQQQCIPTILDAGSMHEGTELLWNQVNYLVASEKFACQFAGDVQTALNRFVEQSPAVVITLGEKGLVWKKQNQAGAIDALSVKSIDTTGAGDAFHGAFAAALAMDMAWLDILNYASAAGALCCTKVGARAGLPWKKEHQQLLALSKYNNGQ